MTCGHVGCCDSSKNQHATAHHQRHHPPHHPVPGARRGLGLVLRGRGDAVTPGPRPVATSAPSPTSRACPRTSWPGWPRRATWWSFRPASGCSTPAIPRTTCSWSSRGALQVFTNVGGQSLLFDTLRAGRISGVLPYSRLTHFPGHVTGPRAEPRLPAGQAALPGDAPALARAGPAPGRHHVRPRARLHADAAAAREDDGAGQALRGPGPRAEQPGGGGATLRGRPPSASRRCRGSCSRWSRAAWAKRPSAPPGRRSTACARGPGPRSPRSTGAYARTSCRTGWRSTGS